MLSWLCVRGPYLHLDLHLEPHVRVQVPVADGMVALRRLLRPPF